MAHPPRPSVDQARLWAGGMASAVVVTLLVAVMSWIVRDVLDVPALKPLADDRDDAGTDLVTDLVAVYLITLLATLVLDLLLVATPTPLRLFHWLAALATIVATLLPVTEGGETDAVVARALASLVVGLTISSLLTGVARRSIRPIPPAPAPWSLP